MKTMTVIYLNARILKTNNPPVDILVVSHAGRNGRNLNHFLSPISPQVLALFLVQYIPHVSLIGVCTYNQIVPFLFRHHVSFLFNFETERTLF